ncbi:maleylpyruvate isomerase family mycothiol-dependent enzyme [Streptomyces sp. NPDC049627]|uniref:maleylpyruvate isomerase family mycothiol-dependent enzyme n=1 Tax=Streptomyces sp. NPDC049627 TaxID=3365595 RepID=UPI00378EE995
MDSTSLLRHLRLELEAFRACLDGDLSARVEHCGEWTLYDLADHLGGGNVWAAAAVSEGHGDHSPAPAPRERAELVGWFEGTADTLLKALDADPSAPAWTFHPPHTVGFWQRRRCMETLIKGLAKPPERALRLVATDTGGSWTYGPGAPVATLSGPVEDLLLLLWGRREATGDAPFAWVGDEEAGRRILQGPLTG